MISFFPQRPKMGIFRALQLGDLLCTIPAVRGLRKAFPQAEIVWIGLPWTPSFVERFSHYIDRCIIFPGYPGLPEQEWQPEKWEPFVQQMQAEAFDLIIQLQGNGTIVNRMLPQLGAKQLAGYHNYESYVNSPLFMEYPHYGHESNRHLRMMQHLGICCSGPELEFPITAAEEKECQQLLATERNNVQAKNKPLQLSDREAQAPSGLPDFPTPGLSDYSTSKYVCIHPGSRGSWRQWPPVAFAKLADECAQRGYTVFITGTAAELPITQEVQAHMKEPAVNLAGKTSLGVLGALIEHASLLIANCTGVSHIAAALHTPSLVISMDGEPERWGPLNQQLHKTIDWTKNDLFENVQFQLNRLLEEVSYEKIF